jgi:hypothetical protein
LRDISHVEPTVPPAERVAALKRLQAAWTLGLIVTIEQH